jgi:preprotein translocase subunit SecE
VLRCDTQPLNVKIKSFIVEVKNELYKASWPWEPKEKGMKKYKELVDSTLLVLIAMLLLSGFVGAWDFLMLNLTTFLTDLATH